jgi:hypothetical protein
MPFTISISSESGVPSRCKGTLNIRLPFFETMSASIRITEAADLYWCFRKMSRLQCHEPMQVSVCQASGRMASALPRSMS